MKILVSQIGAREHYAVARSLHQQGRLAALVTDWYAFGGQSRKQKVENRNKFQLSAFKISTFDRLISAFSVSVFQCLICSFQRFSVSAFQRFSGPSARAARCDAIPDELVRAFPLRSLFWKWRVRRLARAGRSHAAYLQTDSAFASAVARCHLPPHDVFFGYSYASLEMLAAEKPRGVLTVLDQIDPGPVEFRLVAEEMARFPELAGVPAPFPMEYYERNRREWELADVIVVNSEWSQAALIAEGVSPAKIEILPLAFEVAQSREPGARLCEPQEPNKSKFQLSTFPISAFQNVCPPTSDLRPPPSGSVASSPAAPPTSDLRPPTSGSAPFQLSAFSVSAFPPLRVLWLGQVNVRKGIHYLLEAARLLDQNLVAADVRRLKLEGNHPPVHFDIVGPIAISEAAVKSAPPNVRFHGPVSRDRAAEWYRQSDVFVLPTLSDGFALTQLEALAHGLPVIATPNCGRVVEPGKTGFIVPARDPQALAEAILKFAADRTLSATMAPACRAAVKAFSVEAYGKRLLEIIEKRQSGASVLRWAGIKPRNTDTETPNL